MHLFLYPLQKFTIPEKIKLSSSEDNFVVLTSWEKEKTVASHIHPILKIRQEEGEFHPLMKELWVYPDHFHVILRMIVVHFDKLQAILKPHISPNQLILNWDWQYV